MFFRKRKKKLIEKMKLGVDMVKMGTFRRLAHRFKGEYGEEAKLLAGAVTNELFSVPPATGKGEEFSDRNRGRIREELSKLKEDHKIRAAVTEAVRVDAVVRFESGEPETGMYAVEQLAKKGILISGGDVPSPSVFFMMASNYLGETEALE